MYDSTVHIVSAGETPRSLARRYALHKWSAITLVPANADLCDASADLQLEAGITIRIPPSALRLLKHRITLIHHQRMLLQRHFQELEALCKEQLVKLSSTARVPDPGIVETIFGHLEMKVQADVAGIHVAARDIATVNNALALTHLHDQNDLATYVGGTPEYAGLNWLLTPQLLELWYTMWPAEQWAQRFQDQGVGESIRVADLLLNLVRS